jgi:hypothetical protein
LPCFQALADDPSKEQKAYNSWKEEPRVIANLELISQGFENGQLSRSQLDFFLSEAPVTIESLMRQGFPGDAFRFLTVLSRFSQSIKPNEQLDLEREWIEIKNELKLDPGLQEVTTNFARNHFKAWSPPSPAIEHDRNINNRLRILIVEMIRRGQESKDKILLQRVIGSIRLLAYHLKSRTPGNYFCSNEYNAYVRLGFDTEKRVFTILDTKAATEAFDPYSPWGAY